MTVFYAVPTFYAAFLANPSAPERAELKLRLCISAGEALPPEVGRRWKERYGVDMLDGIGSTEMLHIFISNYPGDVKYGTTGKPVPGYDIRLIDDAGNVITKTRRDGRDAGARPDQRDHVLEQPRQDRATRSWANGRARATNTSQDEDGYYVYCGRRDDMLKVGGIYVSPFEVEGALASHPEVLEAAVIAWPDDEELIKPKAFVVLKVGRQGVRSARARIAGSRQGQARALQVSALDRVPQRLPKTATGKIQRFMLRAERLR